MIEEPAIFGGKYSGNEERGHTLERHCDDVLRTRADDGSERKTGAIGEREGRARGRDVFRVNRKKMQRGERRADEREQKEKPHTPYHPECFTLRKRFPGAALNGVAMRGRLIVAALCICAAVAACGRPSTQPPRLPFVAALPSPSVPAWIAEIAPRGTVNDRAQIRVIFAAPVLPVEALGSAREQDVLSHFRLTPALHGAFVVLTPRMIGFQSDGALPAATRVQVTLSAGLHDLQGHTLQNDLLGRSIREC